MPAAPATIDEYIAAAPAEVRPVLQAIRATIRQAAPLAQERISYRMPAFFLGNKALVYFGAFKQHIGLYPPVRQPSLLAQVARYAGPKGNLQLPLSEPMPHALIGQIVRARQQEVAASRPPKPLNPPERHMSTAEKVKGPASYFPSIEKKYGQPIGHWLALVGGLTGMKHMEMVAWLKTEHGLGHGHANATVAHVLAAKAP